MIRNFVVKHLRKWIYAAIELDEYEVQIIKRKLKMPGKWIDS